MKLLDVGTARITLRPAQELMSAIAPSIVQWDRGRPAVEPPAASGVVDLGWLGVWDAMG